MATFIRLLDLHQLPFVFLILPFLLFVLLAIDRCLPFHDRYIVSIFTGATTGFISGFISNVVGHYPTNSSDVVVQHNSYYILVFCMLEFLHLPVVCGVTMYTFCLVFSRPPRLNIVILSLAVATCGTIILNIGMMMIYEPEKTSTTGFRKSTSALIFILIFAVALMTSVRANKQAWLICGVGYILNIHWQSGFLDSVQWNWNANLFPVPGFLSGLVTLFMLDVADLQETHDKTELRRIKRAHEESDSDVATSDKNISTTITWHSFSYIIERTSLTFIMENRNQKSRNSSSETWICCLGMICLLGIFTHSGQQLSLPIRIIIMLLGLVLYISITVTSGYLVNGFFLDDAFGIAFLATAVTSDHIVLRL